MNENFKPHHKRDPRPGPETRWQQKLRRLQRQEIRANTLSLVLIVVWFLLLVELWRGYLGIFD